MINAKNTPADILLLDMNNLGYAAMYVPAFARLGKDGFLTGAIHGSIASLFSRMKAAPGALPVALWDRKATWRHELFPPYKSSRAATPEKLEIRENYRKQVPITQLILSSMGIPQLSCGESEADDLAGHICREIHESWHVQCHTKDTDWLQALRPNVSWFPGDYEEAVTIEDLSNPEHRVAKNDGHFLSVLEFLQCKALAGDASDEVPGIDGVGMKTAAKIIRSNGGSIEEFWSAVDSGQTKPKGVIAQRVASQESRDIYHRNIKLMDWTLAPEIRRDLLALTYSNTNWDELEHLTEKFGLRKVMRDASDILGAGHAVGWRRALDAVYNSLHSDMCQKMERHRFI